MFAGMDGVRHRAGPRPRAARGRRAGPRRWPDPGRGGRRARAGGDAAGAPTRLGAMAAGDEALPTASRPPRRAGLAGTARVDRRTAALLPAAAPRRRRRRSTTSTSTAPPPRRSSTPASSAVVNAAPMISGRYPNLGPAGARRRPASLLVDGIGADGPGPRSGRPPGAACTEAPCYVGDEAVAAGRAVDADTVTRADGRGPHAGWRPSSRRSPTTAPSSCAASRTCCCTAGACPGSATRIAGRPVVVVVQGQDVRRRAARDPAPTCVSRSRS